jgi:hypothetical protein
MSRKERKRMTVMAGVTEDEPTLVQAAVLMAVGFRRKRSVECPRWVAQELTTGRVSVGLAVGGAFGLGPCRRREGFHFGGFRLG